MTQTRSQRAAGLTRHLIAGQMAFSLMLWAGYLAVVAALIIGVAIFREIEVSGWEQGATQIPRWWVLFIGVYIGNTVLPLHVANGQTRRDFARLAAVFMTAFAAFGAVLMVAGFLLEAGVYALMGWPQDLTMSHLFSSAGQLHLVFLEFWLRFLVWGAAGALLGAAFYRSPGLGSVLIPVTIVPMGLAEIGLAADDWWPFGDVPFSSFFEFASASIPLPLAIAAPVVSTVTIAALAWLVIRDVPLRNKGE